MSLTTTCIHGAEQVNMVEKGPDPIHQSCRVRGQAKPYASLLWIQPLHAYSLTTVRLLWLQAVHFGTFTMKHSRTLLLLNVLPSQEPSYWRNSPVDTPTVCMCAHRAAARTRHTEHGNAVWLILRNSTVNNQQFTCNKANKEKKKAKKLTACTSEARMATKTHSRSSL